MLGPEQWAGRAAKGRALKASGCYMVCHEESRVLGIKLTAGQRVILWPSLKAQTAWDTSGPQQTRHNPQIRAQPPQLPIQHLSLTPVT